MNDKYIKCNHNWKYMNVNNIYECTKCGYYKEFTISEILKFELLIERREKIKKLFS